MSKLHNAPFIFFFCVLTSLALFSLEGHFAGSISLYLNIVICMQMCIPTLRSDMFLIR